MLMSQPSVNALRRDNQDATIDFLGRPGPMQVFASNKGLSRLIPFPSSPKNIANSFKVLARLAELRLRRYDELYLFQPILNKESCRRLGLLVKIINAGKSIGRKNCFGSDFVNLAVPENADLHEVERMMSVAKKGLCVSVAETDFCLPFAVPNLAETGKIAHIPYAVLSPGGTKKFRRWPAENFIELSHRLTVSGLDTVFVGDKSERDVFPGKDEGFPLRAQNLIGRTDLHGLCRLIKAARLVIANDSGTMHLANALDVPVVGIFGSGDAVRTGPYRRGKARIVDSSPMACKPCYDAICDSMLCMKSISVDSVWNTAKELLVNHIYRDEDERTHY